MTRNISLSHLIVLGIIHHHPVLGQSRHTKSPLRHMHSHVPVMSARLLPSRNFCSPFSTRNYVELCLVLTVQRMILSGWKMWMQILYCHL